MSAAALLHRELAGEVPINFDRASARQYDADGHLHVSDTNISKATVNLYRGREIPGWKNFGLDADKAYRMLRHPEELAKAAATFDGKPLLLHHKPVNAQDHAFDLTIGALSQVRYEHPYLKAALHVWPGKAIDAIQSERQKELSCGYSYTADMSPGVYDGMPYDGVMRDIAGNHCAIVSEGRAGPDVYVADSKPQSKMECFDMPTALSRKAALVQGALMVTLAPRIAQDKKLDLAPVLKDVTAVNYDAQIDSILEGLKKACDGNLLADAKLDDVKGVLDSLKAVIPATDADPDKDGDDDETPEEKKKRLAALAAARSSTGDSTMVTQDQMKAALDAASEGAAKKAIQLAAEIRDAERTCRPYVGDMSITFDSAESVYKATLTTLGVKDVEKIHPSAYPALLAAQPKPGSRTEHVERKSPAMDTASMESFAKRFPGVDKVRIGA